MKLLLSIVIIVVIAVVGSRLTFLNRRLPLGFRNIIFTGIEYIFLGVLLGQMGLNIIDSRSLTDLEPLLIFGLSIIGFLFGLQFEFRGLRNLPRFFFSISAVQAVAAFFIITPTLYFSFKALFTLRDETVLIMAVTLGSAGCCTAQSALAIVKNNYKVENRRLFSLLCYVASVDGLFALGFFSLAVSIFTTTATEKFSLVASLKWFFISIAIGILCALLLLILSNTKFSRQDFGVFLIGIVLFTGGLALKTGNSPLVIGFVCGIVYANLSKHRLRALAAVVHSERSIYIIMLIIIGAGWTLTLGSILIITGVYFVMRVTAKVVGTYVATRVFKSDFDVPAASGLGLLSEGGFAVAIIINFSLLYPSLSDYLVTVILVSMFVNEILSPKLILSLFDNPKPRKLRAGFMKQKQDR
jgi:Kef-type K+ transport system membrane component KefB